MVQEYMHGGDLWTALGHEDEHNPNRELAWHNKYVRLTALIANDRQMTGKLSNTSQPCASRQIQMSVLPMFMPWQHNCATHAFAWSHAGRACLLAIPDALMCGSTVILMLREQVVSMYACRGFGLVLCVAKALAYLHDTAGIIHLDVKSQNILLTKDNCQAKVADVGLARLLGSKTHLSNTAPGGDSSTVWLVASCHMSLQSCMQAPSLHKLARRQATCKIMR